MYPATEAKGEIHFHQLCRRSGERIRHQNVSTDENPVDKDDIVKGYEYNKGEYVIIEPEDIENLRIESCETLDVTQFVEPDELDPKFYERPYFLAPENPSQAEAFAVVRKALQLSRKIGLGKIAFGGRGHLMGIAAPPDDTELGLMGYILRYPDELRDAMEYFGNIKAVKIDGDQLSLAQELIRRKTAKFVPAKFTDEYETALRAMVEAKIHHTTVKAEPAAGKSAR
jgi:DNA end-binding protein Ku